MHASQAIQIVNNTYLSGRRLEVSTEPAQTFGPNILGLSNRGLGPTHTLFLCAYTPEYADFPFNLQCSKCPEKAKNRSEFRSAFVQDPFDFAAN